MLLARVYGIGAIAAHCQLASLSSLVFEDAHDAHNDAHEQFRI